MFKGLKYIAIIAAILLGPLTANANIFAADRREDVFPVPAHLQPIGILRSVPDDGNWGTAFLVSECHVLTAFHVAFPRYREKGFQPSSRIKSTFHVGRIHGDRLRGFSAQAVGTPVKWGSYRPVDYRGVHGDWALLKLDNCLGRNFGTMSLNPPIQSHQVRSSNVAFAGFPRDRSERPGISLEGATPRTMCQIRDWGPGLLAGFDCAVSDGASGGPILERHEITDTFGQTSIVYVAVGIAIRVVRSREGILPSYSAAHRNLILLTDAFHSEIADAIYSNHE